LLSGPLEDPSGHDPSRSFVGPLSLNHCVQGGGGGLEAPTANYTGSNSSHLHGHWYDNTFASLISSGLQAGSNPPQTFGLPPSLVPVVVLADPRFLQLSALRPVALPFPDYITPTMPLPGTPGSFSAPLDPATISEMQLQQHPCETFGMFAGDLSDDWSDILFNVPEGSLNGDLHGGQDSPDDSPSHNLDPALVRLADEDSGPPVPPNPEAVVGISTPWREQNPTIAHSSQERADGSIGTDDNSLPSNASSTPADQPSSAHAPFNKPYVCSTCNTSWPSRRRLRQHERCHIKRFPCPDDGCQLRFSTRSELNRHRRHQIGDTVPCPHPGCRKTFRGGRKENLNRHLKRFHNDKIEEDERRKRST